MMKTAILFAAAFAQLIAAQTPTSTTPRMTTSTRTTSCRPGHGHTHTESCPTLTCRLPLVSCTPGYTSPPVASGWVTQSYVERCETHVIVGPLECPSCPTCTTGIRGPGIPTGTPIPTAPPN